MKYLVDANVLSEGMRSQPSPEVVSWLARHEAQLAIDPIILGEIAFGILKLPPSRKRASLEGWLAQTVVDVNCLPFTSGVARTWAALLHRLHRGGKAMPIKDSLIAATALHHDLTIVTRNTRDFRNAGVELFDPFATH